LSLVEMKCRWVWIVVALVLLAASWAGAPEGGVRYRVVISVTMHAQSDIRDLMLAIPALREWSTQRDVRRVLLKFPPGGFKVKKCSGKQADYFLFSASRVRGGTRAKFEIGFECTSFPFVMPGEGEAGFPPSKKLIQPTSNIDCDSPAVKTMVKRLKGQATDAVEIARRFYRWIRVNIAYRSAPNPNCKASEVIRKRAGDCLAQATLFVAMMRAAGIPARIVAGYVPKGGGSLHVWAEFFAPSHGWLPVDPAGRLFCELPHGFIVVSKGSRVRLAEGRFMTPFVFQIYNAQWRISAEKPRFEYSVSVTPVEEKEP